MNLRDRDGDLWEWNDFTKSYGCIREGIYGKSRAYLEDTWGPVTEVDADRLTLPVVPDDVTVLVASDGDRFTRDGSNWVSSYGTYYTLAELFDLSPSGLTLERKSDYDLAVEYFRDNPHVRSNAPERHLAALINRAIEENK